VFFPKVLTMNTFEQNIINIYQNQGKDWLLELPNIITSLAKIWNLSQLQPVVNLSFNYVLSGFQQNQPIILKLGLDKIALAREALALTCFENHGGMELLAKTETALLLKRAIPGVSLKTIAKAKPQKALEISCKVMQSLHQAPLSNVNFPHISEWFLTLDKSWNLPEIYLHKARQLRNSLLMANNKPVLLHGDLHHDNILLDGDAWKIIDPKGVLGYPINEIWTFVNDIEQDAPYIAGTFEFEVNKVVEAYFVHVILATCWNLEDNLDPSQFLDLAAKTYKLMN